MRRVTVLALLVVAPIIVLSATAANASFLVSIDGRLSGFDSDLAPFFAIDDPILVSFEVDTSVPDTGSETGDYLGSLRNFSISIGSSSVADMSIPSSSFVQIGNDVTTPSGVQDRILAFAGIDRASTRASEESSASRVSASIRGACRRPASIRRAWLSFPESRGFSKRSTFVCTPCLVVAKGSCTPRPTRW